MCGGMKRTAGALLTPSAALTTTPTCCEVRVMATAKGTSACGSMQVKTCLTCRARIVKLPKWGKQNRAERQFCNRRCAAALRHGSVEERFWAKVRKGDGCW